MNSRVNWVLCHHGTARPQIPDGGEDLQIRRVAANVSNKKSRTANKGWSSSLGVGSGSTPHRNKSMMLRNVSKHLGPGLILWHGLRSGKRTWDFELGMLGASAGWTLGR
jgi:hypothetical protein